MVDYEKFSDAWQKSIAEQEKHAEEGIVYDPDEYTTEYDYGDIEYDDLTDYQKMIVEDAADTSGTLIPDEVFVSSQKLSEFTQKLYEEAVERRKEREKKNKINNNK